MKKEKGFIYNDISGICFNSKNMIKEKVKGYVIYNRFTGLCFGDIYKTKKQADNVLEYMRKECPQGRYKILKYKEAMENGYVPL